MNEEVKNLVIKWRKDAAQYKKQVDEARAKMLPHAQMISMSTALYGCARELENALNPKTFDFRNELVS